MSTLHATPTSAGFRVLESELKNTVTRFSLLGTTTHNAENNSTVEFHHGDITSSYFDDKGALTFTLNLPTETHFDEYLYQINILDKNHQIMIQCPTPKVQLVKGVGGMVTLKVNIAGEAGDIIFKHDEYVSEEELNEIHLPPIHQRIDEVDKRGTSGSKYEQIAIEVGGDADTYYPVLLAGYATKYAWERYSISRRYDEKAPNSWNTETHKGGLTFSFDWSGDGISGGNDKSIRITEFTEQFSRMITGLGLYRKGLVVWLRGGGASYTVNSPLGVSLDVKVHLNGFDDNGSRVEPKAFDQASRDEMDQRYPIRFNGDLYQDNEYVASRKWVGDLIKLAPVLDGENTYNGKQILNANRYAKELAHELTEAPITVANQSVGKLSKFIPFFHQTATHHYGYRTHLSAGLFKQGGSSVSDNWGVGKTGFYVALGGNDSNPTEYFTLTYGGKIVHSKGYTFWSSGNDGKGSGLDADKVHGVDGNKLARTDAEEVVFDGGTTTKITVKADDNGLAEIAAYGDEQGKARIYVGQHKDTGGGIEYNGDGVPATTGAGKDYVTLYRKKLGTYHWTARNYAGSHDWEFRRDVQAQSFTENGEKLEDKYATKKEALGGSGYRTQTITVGGDANKYYPVYFSSYSHSGRAWERYHISRIFNTPAPDSWNNKTHKGGLTFSFDWSGDGTWGGNDPSLRIAEWHETYCDMITRLERTCKGVVVWLRGGGAQYKVLMPSGISQNVTVYLDKFTDVDGKEFLPSIFDGTKREEMRQLYPIRLGGTLYQKDEYVASRKWVEELTNSIFPVGSPIPWPSDSIPSGYALMKGQAFDTSLYPRLAELFPDGVLPNMQGLAIVGKKNGETILSYEADANKDHIHSATISPENLGRKYTNPTGNHDHLIGHSGESGTIGSYLAGASRVNKHARTGTGGNHSHYVDIGPHGHSITIHSEGASENRIKNRKFNWIVRMG